MTAINSDNTSITGSGITSINGEGNFEVSKPTTILASKTNNIAGEVATISPSSSINLTTARINLVTAGPAREGITINANDMPLTLQGKVVIDGSYTTYINTPVVNSKGMEMPSLTVHENIYAKELSANGNIYGKNYGSSRSTSINSIIEEQGARNNIILGTSNTCIKRQGWPVQSSENIIIGNSNKITDEAVNDFIIGRTNIIKSKCSTALGLSNYITDRAHYSLVKGQDNNIQALGATIFGSKNNSTNFAEFGLASGVSNILNGKTSTVLGDNLNGSTETGSMTIGTFNEDYPNGIFIIGNGYQDESGTAVRQNALAISKDGKIESPYVKIDESGMFLKQSTSNASTKLVMGEDSYDIIIKRESNSLKIGSSRVSTGGIYIGTAPGENSKSNQLTKGCINIESKDTINLIAGYNGAEQLVVGGGFKILSSNTGTLSIPFMNISRDMHVSGGNLNEMCKLNFGVNGLYLGSKIDWTNNKLPSSKGNIFYIGDELNYTSGSDNDTQPNYNGILVIGNCNNKAIPTKDNLFIVGNGYQAGDTTNGSNALRLTNDGTLYYKTGMGEGADYAEFLNGLTEIF